MATRRTIRINAESTGLGLAISFISIISLVHLNTPSSKEFGSEYIVSYGGYTGGIFVYILRFLLGNIGAYVVVLALLVIGIVILTGIPISRQFSLLIKGAKALFKPKAEVKKERFLDERQTALDFPKKKMSTFYEQLSLDEKEASSKTKVSPAETNNFVSQKTTELKIEIPKIEVGKYQLPPISLLKRTVAKGPQLKKDIKGSVNLTAQLPLPGYPRLWLPPRAWHFDHQRHIQLILVERRRFSASDNCHDWTALRC